MAKNQNNNTVAPATKKTEPEAKKDALATALAQIEKQFGKGAVMKLGDNASMQVDAISTGSLGLDLALGVGGVPRGRIIEVYGPESSGKTNHPTSRNLFMRIIDCIMRHTRIKSSQFFVLSLLYNMTGKVTARPMRSSCLTSTTISTSRRC